MVNEMEKKITVIPAIDIIGGKCVRLTRGDYESSKVYYDDPLEAALRFEEEGMERLHLVDLDGAAASRVMNAGVLERICKYTRLRVDFSGGIKSDDDICRVFDAGASFVCLGSMAQQDRRKTAEWLERYGRERVIVGADVRNEKVYINGWKRETETTVFELVEWYRPMLKYLMCTDIERDGMLAGVALPLYRKLLARFPELTLIASGGVSSREDVKALAEIGIAEVIVGKALYEFRV
jgi:1-(5-phosphoribosyl)-5-[(5-phosphoribosylamino)methylideneamino]imidazole-4-carboxamide isomerase